MRTRSFTGLCLLLYFPVGCKVMQDKNVAILIIVVGVLMRVVVLTIVHLVSIQQRDMTVEAIIMPQSAAPLTPEHLRCCCQVPGRSIPKNYRR